MTTTSMDESAAHPGYLPQFRRVASVAQDAGVSSMTLYRMISEGQYPAVRIRTRLVVPVEDASEVGRDHLPRLRTSKPAWPPTQRTSAMISMTEVRKNHSWCPRQDSNL